MKINKRGFTFVELLAVITIIGVLALIVLPTIENMTKENKEKIYQRQLNNIILSLKSWASDNRIYLPEEENEKLTITLGNLKSEGYIEYDVKNPLTGVCFDNSMALIITKVKKNYDYSIDLDTIKESNNCEISIDSPVIALNGNMLENIEVNSTYVDKGVIAKDKDGNDITNSVTMTISGGGNFVDTSKIGNQYIITYSITDNDITMQVSRTIKIVDTLAPELSVPGDVVIDTTVASLDIMSGVSATDNSGETISVVTKGHINFGTAGKYTITYTATDSSGNVTNKKRSITINKPSSILSSTDECIKRYTMKCPAGTKVNVQVNASENHDFYVINDTGTKLTLIMNNNLYEAGAPAISNDPWINKDAYLAAGGSSETWDCLDCEDRFMGGDNTKGPLSALQELKKRTSNWTNIAEYSYVLDYGTGTYNGEYVQNVRSRLPRLSDIISGEVGCTKDNATCPSWVYAGLEATGDNIAYWLSDASTNFYDSAWLLGGDGGLVTDGVGWVLYTAGRGIRPVIEITK